jgi:signal transduction histidine kinase
MRAYASSLTESANIKLEFESNLSNNKLEISMLQRKNLYLIFKEAVNNAVKHGHATNIGIQLNQIGHQLQLIVADNGKGINNDNNNVKMGGNGLTNMHSRAKESGGTFIIQSEPNKGTTVQFNLNL